MLFVLYTVRAKVEGFILWCGEAGIDKVPRGVGVAFRGQVLDPTFVQDPCQSVIVPTGKVHPWPVFHGVLLHLGRGAGDFVVGEIEVIDRVNFLAQRFERDTLSFWGEDTKEEESRVVV